MNPRCLLWPQELRSLKAVSVHAPRVTAGSLGLAPSDGASPLGIAQEGV